MVREGGLIWCHLITSHCRFTKVWLLLPIKTTNFLPLLLHPLLPHNVWCGFAFATDNHFSAVLQKAPPKENFGNLSFPLTNHETWTGHVCHACIACWITNKCSTTCWRRISYHDISVFLIFPSFPRSSLPFLITDPAHNTFLNLDTCCSYLQKRLLLAISKSEIHLS